MNIQVSQPGWSYCHGHVVYMDWEQPTRLVPLLVQSLKMLGYNVVDIEKLPPSEGVVKLAVTPHPTAPEAILAMQRRLRGGALT